MQGLKLPPSFLLAEAGAKRGERARVPTRSAADQLVASERPAGRETCQSMHRLGGNQLPRETRAQRPWGALSQAFHSSPSAA